MNEIKENTISIQSDNKPDNNDTSFSRSLNLKIRFKIDTALHDDDRNNAIKLGLVRQDLTVLCWGETTRDLRQVLVEESFLHK